VSVRRGFTLAETIVAAAIFTLIVAIVASLYAGATRGANLSVEASDALRSTLIAAEYIRRDVGEMLFQLPDRDLVISPDRHALTIRVPGSLPEDFWKADFEGLIYRLERMPGTTGTFRLVRQFRKQSEAIAGCLLQDVTFTHVRPGGLSPLQAYLQVTLVGLGSADRPTTYTYSMFLPLTKLKAPQPMKFARGAR
jgi:prepilin-type N-terminal cleavage/methylation domain-containing protein